jgi:hypothetical protein
MLYASGCDFVLIYPEEWDKIPYVQATLKAFPNLKVEKIPVGVHVQVPNLLLPEVRPFTACLNEIDTKDVSEHMQQFYYDEIQHVGKTPQRLFVNRKKASCRKIKNYHQVRALIEQNGFTEVDFDDLTFVEQMAYVHNARQIIMLHGAGMTNIMFAQPKTKVLELMHEYTEPRNYRFIYWFLTVQMQCDYFVQFCRTIDTNIDEWRKDLIVDTELLEENLKLMMQ